MKYKVLIKDGVSLPEQMFDLIEIEANDARQAWGIIEEEIMTCYGSVWLLNEEEFNALKKCVLSQND